MLLLIKQDLAVNLLYFLTVKDITNTSETQQDTRSVYEYTRPVCQAGGRRGRGTKSSAVHRTLLPNTGYTTLFTSHNWVHTKKVSVQCGSQVTGWRLWNHWNSQIKRVPSAHPCRACQKGRAAFLSLPLPPSCPAPSLLLLHWLTKNNALGSAGPLQRAVSSHWINQRKKALCQW